MTQPRGIRNNNPGNLRRSKDNWRGLSPEQTDPDIDDKGTMCALAAAIATARAVETIDQRVTRLEKENARLRRRLRQHKINV